MAAETVAATVVVPTFDHGPTLRHSLASALAQTVEDLEVNVIGDGVPAATREIVREIAAQDPRVRFFDKPKGPRNGEKYRHDVLAGARGEVVCYLADDDLWLPDHVETMRELLRDADFAAAPPVRFRPDGTIVHSFVDLGLPIFRELMAAGIRNWVPLSCAAHTLAAYRRLPEGWTTTPDGRPTDLYMWGKFFRLPGLRAVSGTRPTVVVLPSPMRRTFTIEERAAEVGRWRENVENPAWRAEFPYLVLDHAIRDRARAKARLLRYRIMQVAPLRATARFLGA